MRLDYLVEGSLHVQHHGVQTASRVGPVPVLIGTPIAPDAWHQTRGVVQGSQAHRLREPARRVDGQHDHMPAALGGAHADRGRGGRLADPAGAAADDDPGPAIGDQPVDVKLRGAPWCHHAAFWSRSADASWYRPARPIPPVSHGSW